MPTYITVTYDTQTIDIAFNDLAGLDDIAQSRWTLSRGQITDCVSLLDGTVVITTSRGSTHTLCSVLDLLPNCLPIQSINGATPTDNANLHELIKGLL